MEKASVFRTAREDLRRVPSVVSAVFCVAVVSMNLLANKTIYQSEVLALDGGLFVSWIAFLCMDVVVKAFGQRAATTLSFFAMVTNLIFCLLFFLVSIVPTETDYSGFNTIFGGTWFILLNSSIAFILSAVLNNALNVAIGKRFTKNPDGKLAFITRSYVSTFISQLVDNLVFVVLTFMVFAPVFWDGFSWTFLQCVTCSVFGAVMELAVEALFSPLGYMLLKKWRQDGIWKNDPEVSKA